MRTELGEFLRGLVDAKEPESFAAASVRMYVSDLTDDELDVIGYVAEGIREGRGKIGPLDLASDGRNFRREAGMEARDLLFYASCEYLKRLMRGNDRGQIRVLPVESWDPWRDEGGEPA